MGAFWAFLTLLAGLIFAMGLVTHPSGTAQVANSLGSGLTNLFTLELGKVPSSKTG